MDSELLYAIATQSQQGSTAYYAPSSTPPASNTAGDLWYQTDTGYLAVNNGSGWLSASMYTTNPSVRMYTPTNQTVAAGSSVVSFNAVTYNFGGGTTNLTGSTVNGQGPYSYNPNVPGVYAVSISIMGQANNNPQLQQAFLYKNGAAFSAGPPITLRSPSTGDQNSSTLSDHVYLNGTSDYIQAVFYNNGANTLALVGAANNTWMSAVLVARD